VDCEFKLASAASRLYVAWKRGEGEINLVDGEVESDTSHVTTTIIRVPQRWAGARCPYEMKGAAGDLPRAKQEVPRLPLPCSRAEADMAACVSDTCVYLLYSFTLTRVTSDLLLPAI
jgi:hypothetical protein